MEKVAETLTVSRAAQMCGVGRTTVGYWIRSGKLSARRQRRNYVIAVDDLLYYLKNSRHPIPAALLPGNSSGPIYKRFRRCWEYHQEKNRGGACAGCVVRRQQIPDCFTLMSSQVPGRRSACSSCGYYRELVGARIQFIHQLELPAVVFKNFSTWGGNRQFCKLCGLSTNQLVGRGIERIVHPDSLAEAVAGLKQLALGRAAFANPCRVAIFNPQQAKMNVDLTVLPLNDPPGTWLSMVTNHRPGFGGTADIC